MGNFKIDFDEIKRMRMGMLMGLDPDSPDSWPQDIIDRLIDGEQEHGFEWLMAEIEENFRKAKVSKSNE